MRSNAAIHRFRPSAGDSNHYHIATALPFFNPTCALLTPDFARLHTEGTPSSALAAPHDPSQSDHSKWLSPAIAYKWTSRNNRKGRHALSINPNRMPPESRHLAPHATTSLRKTAWGIWRMATVCPIWDISYDVATIFTLGSVVWVVNAFFVWLPLVQPGTEFKDEELYGGGITAFVGATIFMAGSILLVAEAVNEDRSGCFGWALERALSHESAKGSGSGWHLRPSESECAHHHLNKSNLLGRGNSTESLPDPEASPKSTGRAWIWCPSIKDLRTHYIRELGFLASFTQLAAATIFWVSGFTALPGIYDNMSRPVTIILYWTPQVIGGSGFILSGALFMLETQSRWYKPAFKTLGWWVGAWNLVGGIGFTLCPAFGYDESSWAQYQACLSTFWGSWAFWIGSCLQWYESLEKWPVEINTNSSSSSEESIESVGKEGVREG
ncbi:hypothetical protein K458DRAFT_415598 [Lentithecium fluviatile CBS 122367]|uniref:Integral membrane protein n=1 Tax=Lentithecium fluviatile CBS 122367 TaxID=1168545 RepID=A0A6G1JAU3_9PLEO|nr:hypothetical protein K458DRAFT_415598 [Lentithecium fluviatile CBS 122367]